MPTPEELARINIDKQLEVCGWTVQSRVAMNLYAGRGVAVSEFPVQGGFADYLLFVDRLAFGVIEAKKVGMTLSGVVEVERRLSAVGEVEAAVDVGLVRAGRLRQS